MSLCIYAISFKCSICSERISKLRNRHNRFQAIKKSNLSQMLQLQFDIKNTYLNAVEQLRK